MNTLSDKTPKRLAQKRAGIASYLAGKLIAAGVILLLSAGVLTGYGLIDDYLAGQRAQTVLEQMRKDYSVSVAYQKPALSDPAIIFEAETNETGESVVPDNVPSPDRTELPGETARSPVISPVPKYNVIGVLTIPGLTLELPVLNEYTEDLLKISVCRYEGEVLDKPVRLAVAGHNYKSHFGKLRSLAVGDEVCFNNIAGVTYCYTVIEISDISMYDHEAIELGEWDIALFTCDSDRSRRILVKCRENPQE